MYGTLPMVELAPLEYRYALDAAMTVLAGAAPTLVRCDAPDLLGEVAQRLPWSATHGPAPSALWVEPQVGAWRTDLAALAGALRPGAPLVIVASRPLARLIPERSAWPGDPLGLQAGGIARLAAGVHGSGFVLGEQYGIHTILSTGLNVLSRQVDRLGRADIGARLHFAARLRYHTSGPLAALATVALLIARKGDEGC